MKKVESNDVHIVLYTFSDETIILDIPKGDKQEEILNHLFVEGYAEITGWK